jgi:hypothetical protein
VGGKGTEIFSPGRGRRAQALPEFLLPRQRPEATAVSRPKDRGEIRTSGEADLWFKHHKLFLFFGFKIYRKKEIGSRRN